MAGSIPNRRIFIQDVLDGEGNINPERLLYVTNTFMESVFVLFEKNIEFNTNVNADIIELSFNTPTDYVATQNFNPIEFGINIKGKKAQGCILARIQKTDELSKVFLDPVTLTWVESKDKLKITYITGLEDKTAYKINVLVI